MPSSATSLPFVCPACADAFKTAWDRDEHFDTFHVVFEATLLPTANVDLPPLSRQTTGQMQGPAQQAAAGAVITNATSKKRSSSPLAGGVHKPGPRRRAASSIAGFERKRSKYRSIFYDPRKVTKRWYYQIRCWRSLPNGLVLSAYFDTEEETLAGYAESARKCGIPEVPALRQPAKTTAQPP